MKKSKVAVLKTQPESVVEDYIKLIQMAEIEKALDKNSVTILIPVLYNFEEKDMKWIDYKPKSKLRALDKIFPEGIRLPDYFFGKNIVHLPTMKCHIYNDNRCYEKCLWWFVEHQKTLCA